MKKVSLTAITVLISFSMFSTLCIEIKAESEVTELWRVPIIDNIDAIGTDAGDVDGDGIEDVAIIPRDISRLDVNTLQVIKSDGTPLWSKSVLIDGASVAIGDVDVDGKGEVFLFGRKSWSNYGAIVYAFDDDGTELWPEPFNGRDDYWGGISYVGFLNLDGDPQLEILAASSAWGSYTNYALDTDGSLLCKFSTDEYMSQMIFTDLTGDGVEEIVLVSFQKIYVLDKSCTLVRPPQPLHSSILGAYVEGGDVTGDGIDDLAISVVGYDSAIFHNTLYVIRNDGIPLWNKPYPPDQDNLITNPLVFDVDGDGIKDVVLYGGRKISAHKNDSSLLWPWGNSTFFDKPFPWYPILHFDINRDLKEEIVFQRDEKVYALSLEGNLAMQFVLPNNGGLTISHNGGHVEGREIPRYGEVADVNNDGFDELIINEIIDGQHYVAAVMPPVAKIGAALDIAPDTLNLRSEGKWITAYIQLPEEYDPKDIDAATILLNGTIQPVLDPKYDFVTNSSAYIVDHDGEGILERMVKFDRAEVMALLSVGDATLTITGQVSGIPFEGSDTVRVIDE